MIAWSYTRLKDFERCPLIFNLKYLKKEIVFKENEATRAGSAKHKTLENAAKVLIKHPDQTFVQSDLSHVFPIVRSFVKSQDTVIPEQELAFRKDTTVCSWFDKDTWLRVKIDLLGVRHGVADSPFEHHSDVAMALDWKTGKIRVDEDQLRLYNLAVLMSDSKIWQVSSAFAFIDHKETSKVVVTTRESMSAELAEWSDRAEAINIAAEKDEWPAVPNQFCSWCDATGLQCEYKI